MSETPQGEEARRIVDDLEDDIVDVDGAQAEDGTDDQAGDDAEDRVDDVPGAPEPTD
jgi:hypothetical protein